MGNTTKRRAPVGKPDTVPPDHGFSLISNKKLMTLYAGLLKCRMAEDGASCVPQPGEHPMSFRGREAGTIGATIDLTANDRLTIVDPAILGEAEIQHLRAVLPIAPQLLPNAHANGSAKNGHGRERRLSAQMPDHAAVHTVLGAALAQRTGRHAAVTVLMAAENGLSAWSDALRIAAVHCLPIIFVEQTPGHPKPNGKLGSRSGAKQEHPADTPFLPCIVVDSHDVVAIYRVASEAIARARKGRGPTVIQCRPFSLLKENAARPQANGKRAIAAHDAIAAMEQYLRGKGLLSDTVKAKIITQSSRALERSRGAARDS